MIPNKSNFKFQELTPITGVKPYVLRFWEAEFDEIDPVTSDSGQKLYARKDVEAILTIKRLLFEQKLSIQEAKESLKSGNVAFEASTSAAPSRKNPLEHPAIPVLKEALELIHAIKLRRNWF
jgi:DNA-binding transcriptional MerR regulator